MRGKDLLELGERAHRGLLDAGHADARRRPQPDGDGHRLLLVEQQRRHLGAGAEAVAAADAGRRADRIAECPQPLDVAPNRARVDLEALGERRPAPARPCLEQRQEAQQARRGLDHAG